MNKKENIELKDYTTFYTGGRAKYLIEVESEDVLVKAVKFAKDKDLPIFVLGGGSDILVSDDDFDGVVIRLTGQDTKWTETDGHVEVTAEAGLSWDKLVELAVDSGLGGIEAMSGIPGTVGASPIQNIGAYGQELKDTFLKLRAYDMEDEKFKEFTKQDCEFSYRESLFKKPENKGRFVITEVTLRLEKSKEPEVTYKSLRDHLAAKGIAVPTLKEVRNAVLELRGRKLEDPGIVGNAGSFFKNPIISSLELQKLTEKHGNIPSFETEDGMAKLFSGWLIEEAGWKGKSLGNAKVSEKNALVLTNPEKKATAKEIKALSEAIIKSVEEKFGVTLEPEVQFIQWN